MCVKMNYFWIFVIFLSNLRGSFAIKKGYYTIVAPAKIHPGSTFHVSLTLNDFHKSSWFNISLKGYKTNDVISSLESIEVKPLTTKLVQLSAPPFTYTDSAVNMEVSGYRGIINKQSELIFLEAKSHWAFIQINQPKYRPGELVKFRVICIDQLTRPAKLNGTLTVKIYDSVFDLISNIEGKLVQGVLKSELQLSQFPTLGTWTIRVQNDKIESEDINFEVTRYVPPKFNVRVNAKLISIYDRELSVEISASYFHGGPVRGNLSLKMENVIPGPYVAPPFTGEFHIDGIMLLSLDLEKDLRLKIKPDYYPLYSKWSVSYQYGLKVFVTDDLTEEQSEGAANVFIYNQPFKFKVKASNHFDPLPMFNLKIKVRMTDLYDNPVEDTQTPIEIIHRCFEKDESTFSSETKNIVRNDYKEESGKDFMLIPVKNKDYDSCYMYAEYKNSSSSVSWVSNSKTTFDLDIITESPQEGKELEIKMTNKEPFEEFSYEILSKGDIVQADRVNIAENVTTYILRINVTSDMLLKMTIYVHLIKNSSFLDVMKDVAIEKLNPNSIEIISDNEVAPGSSVFLNVTTDEGSYVGLMGLDKRILDKQVIFDEDIVNSKISIVNSLSFYNTMEPYSGQKGDFIILSNILPSSTVFGGGVGVFKETIPIKEVRKRFPESWLFLDFENTPAGGLHILDNAPDTITTWSITGFSINSRSGLSFTKNVTNIRVFQQFFISMDLPNIVREGEIIEIQYYITNNFKKDLETNVIIAAADSQSLGILDKSESQITNFLNYSMVVPANTSTKNQFFVNPLKPGEHNITLQAISPLANDGIQKTLHVQSHGIPYAMVKTFLVYLPEESTQEDEINIEIPKNAVPGSQRVEVAVVGDIFGPLMRKIKRMARVPYGNAEDNMILIISNSIVLKYFKVLNYSNPILEGKLKENIELGFQNQLSYKYLDGSFGFFDRTEHRTGDVWQTVFALWGLKQANEFVKRDYIDSVINRGLDYLKSKQRENGCFKSESGIEDDVKFTSFGMMVFIMNRNRKPEYEDVITKGLGFLYETTDDLEDSSISALSTYILLLEKHQSAGDHVKKLTASSNLKINQMVWTKSDTLDSLLKITAESLLHLFETAEIPHRGLLEIVRSLIVLKKEDSPITHMLALQVMIAFVEKLSFEKSYLNIVFKDDNNKSGEFLITKENSKVQQTSELGQNSRKIHFQSKGKGFAVIDVRYSYNLEPDSLVSSFYATNISTQRLSKFVGMLEVCLSSLANLTHNTVTVMEVNLPSSFLFTEKFSLTDKFPNENIKAIQVNDDKDKVLIYFDVLTNETCVELEIRKNYKVYNSKPGLVTVYDVQNKDEKGVESFSIDDFDMDN